MRSDGRGVILIEMYHSRAAEPEIASRGQEKACPL